MKIEADSNLVTIYINSTDQWQGAPLYAAIVELCRQRGIAGATVTRCVEGYGGGHHLHTARLLEVSENLPVRIEIIDATERIEPLLLDLETMIAEGLVTVSNVHALHFAREPKK